MFYAGTEKVLKLKLEEIGVLKPKGLHCMLKRAVLLIVTLTSMISKDRREKRSKGAVTLAVAWQNLAGEIQSFQLGISHEGEKTPHKDFAPIRLV